MAIFSDLYVFTWDFFLSLYNVVSPDFKVGHVVPEGHPGAGGKWPEYVPPGEGDSRCACPMLNAMANHGILPHDGKNISFVTMNEVTHATYNFSPSFCYFVPNYIAKILKKDYSKDKFDLAEISVHNGIEHDASLTREDTYHQPDQGKPHELFVNELLALASGKDPKVHEGENRILTPDDLARYSAKRRTEAQERNPEFSLSLNHKMFGSSNTSGLISILGGRVSDLRDFLIDERIPEGWESSVRARKGLTLTRFNFTVIPLELSTAKYVKRLKSKSKAKKLVAAEATDQAAPAAETSTSA